MNRPSIWIVVDGGPNHGLGHLRRSMALADAFRARRYLVRIEGNSESSRRYLRTAPSDKLSPFIAIIDLPYNGDTIQRQIRRKGLPVVGLDYLGEVEPDLQIGVFEQPGWSRGKEILVGLEFAIIRRFPIPTAKRKGVVVCLGGSDVKQIGPTVARTLHDQGEDVTLICGPFSEMNQTNETGYRTLANPPDFEARLAGCQWAVTNGGTTLLEAMSLKKAVHVIPQTNEETRLAGEIARRGGLLGSGLNTLRIPDASRAVEIGLAAGRLVDGKGVERIITAIEERWPNSLIEA